MLDLLDCLLNWVSFSYKLSYFWIHSVCHLPIPNKKEHKMVQEKDQNLFRKNCHIDNSLE